MAQVFVSIAAYDDWGLPATVCNLLLDPGLEVRVGVVLQTDDEKLIRVMRGMPCVDMLHIPKGVARGVSWSRALTQTLYEGEPWFAQFDAHMVDFDPQWAWALVRQSEQVGGKPVLTSRPVPHDYQGDPAVAVLFPGNFDDFGLGFDGALWKVSDFNGSPIPARGLGGALVWAPGSFVEEVPSDPRVYFNEEFSLVVRAWTSGYDLWHPAATVCKHDYSGNPREWAADPEWVERHDATIARLSRLYAGEGLGAYGVGSVRSLSGFQEWSGINLEHRTAVPDSEWRKGQPFTVDNGLDSGAREIA